MKVNKLKLISLGKSQLSEAVSLPEILIALFIIVVSLVTFLTLATTQLRTLKFAKEKFMANILALEGLELIQAYRNQRLTQDLTNWLGDLSKKGDYCIFINENNTLQVIGRDICDGKLYLSNGVYTHERSSLSVPTLYKRIISVRDNFDENKTDLRNSKFVRVISKVSYPAGEINLEMILTKWHPLFSED